MSLTSLSYERPAAPEAALLPVPCIATADETRLSRLALYAELIRPRIAALVLVTVSVGSVAGSWGMPDGWRLLHTLLATVLVAASAGALNQWLERESDRLMPRTAQRPLPSGRLAAGEALAFGIATGLAGLAYFAWCVNLPTALAAALTWLLYVWVYTPLKARTVANTAIGAVAGALPILMGWFAVEGKLDLPAATLFSIVYLWQFPHFMAIAWMYREQYAAAGLQMLSVVDPTGRRAGRQAVVGAALLLMISMLPALVCLAPHRGPWYLAGAIVLGGLQLFLAVRFARQRTLTTARILLRASLIYLPGLLSLLMVLRLL